MTTQAPAEKPSVLILNLETELVYDGLFYGLYSGLVASLEAEHHIERARSLGEAQRYLNEHQPVAIIIPDPALTLKRNSSLLQQVRSYVHAGGCAICSCLFSSFITPLDMNKFWQTGWGLDWKFGKYYRTDVHLNWSVPHLPTTSLTHEYSQKAVFLDNVTSDDAVYRPSSYSVARSPVLANQLANPDDAAVAFTKVGEGWLGYIGDVNHELGSQAVMLSMLDLAAGRSGIRIETWVADLA